MSPPSDATTADADVPEATERTDGPKLLEHAYDGIHEYDNPLPGWWRVMFWATSIFALGYWLWFQVAQRGTTPEQDYRAALADYESKRELRDAKDAENVSEAQLASNARDPKIVARGAQVFAAKCASCHAEHGQGLIGPNLTDLHQIHGSTRMDLYATVTKGAPGTAMLAWGEQMAAVDIVAAVSFVSTLRGQQLTGKEPQGSPVQAFEQ